MYSTESLEIIVTGDGSHSILNTNLDEAYHSRHGALAESTHVFINNGLEYESQQTGSLNILEVGLGSGLNLLLSIQWAARTGIKLRYLALEPYPVPGPVWKALNYSNLPGTRSAFNRIHDSDWNTWLEIENVALFKSKEKLEDALLPASSFNVVYYDPFASVKQQEMWTASMLKKVVEAMKSGGAFVTYAATGQLRRDLKQLGLSVERLVGAPGKKEMTRGVKPNSPQGILQSISE